MAPPDKKKRRQSTVFPDLAKKRNVMSENELHNYYMNKNYVAPEKIMLETIFEGSPGNASGRRGGCDSGELVKGKNLAKRYIEDYKFWRQNDKERNRRRKSMIQKQFKGRKRLKIVPSGPDKEEELMELIRNAPDIETFEEPREESEEGKLLLKTYQLILSRSRSLPSHSQSSQSSSQPEISHPTLLPDSDSCSSAPPPLKEISGPVIEPSFLINNGESTDETGSLIRTVKSKPGIDNDISNEIDDHIRPSQNNEPSCSSNNQDYTIQISKQKSVGDCHNSFLSGGIDEVVEETNTAEQFGEKSTQELQEDQTFNPALILQSMQDEGMRKEFLKALEDTDLMFCDDNPVSLNTEPSRPKKTERASMRRSVRRSARLMPHQQHVAGSVDIEVDIVPKQSKQKMPKKKDEAFVADGKMPVSKPKKKKIRAKIMNSAEASKENVPSRSVDRRKRRPGLKEQLSDSSFLDLSNLQPSSHNKSDPATGKDDKSDTLEKNLKRRSSLDNSSRRQSTDISLPDCVRRSLTGEFVPVSRLSVELDLLDKSRMSDGFSSNLSTKDPVGQKIRNPLEPIILPTINIESVHNTSSFLGEQANSAKCEIKARKDSFDFSDDEYYMTGMLKLPNMKRANLLNQRIFPSVSSVDSDFG